MSTISTHILDTSRGVPAQGIRVVLSEVVADRLREVAHGVTNGDGRIADWRDTLVLSPGTYEMHFATGAYFSATGGIGFYPEVNIRFAVPEPSGHYHIPLLLSPFGYSTYRGS